MMPLATQGAAETAFPLWLMVAVGACLPVTLVVLWRIGEWWHEGQPLPLPLDEAVPAVPWPPWFGLALFVGMTLAMGLIQHYYEQAAKAGLLPWEPLHVPDMFSPRMFLAQIVPPLAGLGLARLYGRGAAAAVGVRTGPVGRTALYGLGALAAALPVCVAALVAAARLMKLAGVPQEVHPLLVTVQSVRAAWVLPMAILQAGVLAALAEEFMYRGVLLMTLLKEIGFWPALVFSSAVFAAVHFFTEPQAVAPLFILAMAMGYVAYRTRSLLAPVVTHALFNSLMVATVFAAGR